MCRTDASALTVAFKKGNIFKISNSDVYHYIKERSSGEIVDALVQVSNSEF